MIQPVVREPEARAPFRFLGLLTELRWAFVALVMGGHHLLGRVGERIAHNDGLGDDGIYFAKPALLGLSALRDKLIDSYYLQRVLPALVIRGVCKLLGLEATIPRVVAGYQLQNSLLIGLSALLYFRVAERLSLSPLARWWGGIAIFLSFGVAKWSIYDPVLTDFWAFAIGWIYLVCWLERRPLLLIATTAVGAFCWPSAVQVGCALLLCLGFGEPTDAGVEPSPRRASTVVGVMLAGAYAAYTLHVVNGTQSLPNAIARAELWCLPASIAIGAVFLCAGVAALGDDAGFFRPTRWLRGVLGWPFWAGVCVWVGSVRIIARYTNGAVYTDPRELLPLTAYTSAAKPAVFLLAHALFFGPLILVLVLRHRAIAARMREAGAGVVACGVLFVTLGLNSESRRLFLLVPFIVPFVIQELDRHFDARAWLGLCGWALLGSKIWLQLPVNVEVPNVDLPPQTVFMNLGPWMAWNTYERHALIAGLALLWLHRTLTRCEARPGLRLDPPTSSR